MIVPQVTLSMDVTKVDAQAFEFFVNPIQSQNLQIWQGYHLSIFKSYVFLQNLEGIAQELNMRLLGYCGRWISHEGPLQGSGTSIIPNSDPPSSLSYRTTPLVPVNLISTVIIEYQNNLLIILRHYFKILMAISF